MLKEGLIPGPTLFDFSSSFHFILSLCNLLFELLLLLEGLTRLLIDVRAFGILAVFPVSVSVSLLYTLVAARAVLQFVPEAQVKERGDEGGINSK